MERALTIRQPWAWAVAWGHKPVENRSGGAWRWAHARGELWVHAASTWSDRGAADARVVSAWQAAGEPDPYRAKLDRPERVPGTRVKLHPTEHDGTPPARRLHLGAVIGKVVVTDVHNASPGCCATEWAESSYTDAAGRHRTDLVHLVLADPRYLAEPVPCTGRLGLWRADPELAADLGSVTADLAPAGA